MNALLKQEGVRRSVREHLIEVDTANPVTKRLAEVAGNTVPGTYADMNDVRGRSRKARVSEYVDNISQQNMAKARELEENNRVLQAELMAAKQAARLSKYYNDKRVEAASMQQRLLESQLKAASTLIETMQETPQMAKSRSRSKKNDASDDIPQVTKPTPKPAKIDEKETPVPKQKRAIKDKSKSKSVEIPQVIRKLAIEDRSPFQETPYLAQQSKALKARSRTPYDRERIPGPTKAQFKAAALPSRHVTDALAHHDLNQLEKLAKIAREIETAHVSKKQKTTSKPRAKSQVPSRKIKA
jgi:hypothetical protein